MTGDSRTPEQAARKPANGPQSAPDPTVDISGGARGTSGPQTGTQGPDPRHVIRDTIHTTLNASGYWLPIEAQHAIADAILNLRNNDAETWRRKAVERGLELGRLQRTLELAESTARTWIDGSDGGTGACAQAVVDALTAYPPKEQPTAIPVRARCRCGHARDLHNSRDCAGCTHAGLQILSSHAFITREDQQ
ncbi:hypothetical protein [Streptomyces showdoensis]|uniref:Uncharacterized protein n=1 Tax=Streptomyces showdoensis TaxID=68268 RepID=A0A2P2GTP9_STREW|nr:hypothetical protein [Streptomyces showdoensis]KKZ74866.1 hypothetical protein VO63_05300 [Streptomyces showdoensis]